MWLHTVLRSQKRSNLRQADSDRCMLHAIALLPPGPGDSFDEAARALGGPLHATEQVQLHGNRKSLNCKSPKCLAQMRET